MSNPDTFFSDLLAAEGPMIEPHQAEVADFDPSRFVTGKKHHRKAQILAICVLALGVALNQNNSGAADADSSKTSGTTSVEKDPVTSPDGESPDAPAPVMTDYDSKAAQDQLSKRIYSNLVYDYHYNQAKDYANRDMIPECEAAVLELGKVSIGPPNFDCDLSDNGY